MNCLYYISCCYYHSMLCLLLIRWFYRWWSFRQLGALTMDSTYQGSFFALASTGEGIVVPYQLYELYDREKVSEPY